MSSIVFDRRCAFRFTRALRRWRVSLSEWCAIPPCGWCSSDPRRRLDLLRQLDRIKCPTLIVAGDDDPITPVADMEDIAAALRRDLVRLESFANAGHGVYRDRPEAFFRLLRDFMVASRSLRSRHWRFALGCA
jgi:pimeloyl-ACP methyl ester carboxylesterase